MPFDVELLPNRFEDGDGQSVDLASIARKRLDDDEFVAAEAGDEAAFGDLFSNACRLRPATHRQANGPAYR